MANDPVDTKGALALDWSEGDGHKWECFSFDVYDNEVPRFMVTVEDDGTFKAWAWVAKDTCYTERKTGPLAKSFDCLCQAKRAVEAHFYAKR